jgi:hypothetical protein
MASTGIFVVVIRTFIPEEAKILNSRQHMWSAGG